MKRTRAEAKADLTKLADEVIDELLDWTEDTATPTLTQIEDMVLKLRQRLSERMAQAVIETQEAVRPVPGRRVRRVDRKCTTRTRNRTPSRAAWGSCR